MIRPVAVYPLRLALAEGPPELLGMELGAEAGLPPETVLGLLAAAVSAASHPYAEAVRAQAARSAAPRPARVDGAKDMPGWGAGAVCDGRAVLLGTTRLLVESGLVMPARLLAAAEAFERAGEWALHFGWDGKARGFLRLRRPLRREAAAEIAALRAAGFRVEVFSAGSAASLRAAASRLGADRLRASLPDAEQDAELARLRARGERVFVVRAAGDAAAALAWVRRVRYSIGAAAAAAAAALYLCLR